MFRVIDILSNITDCLLFYYMIASKNKSTTRSSKTCNFFLLSVFIVLFISIKMLPVSTAVSLILILILFTLYSHCSQSSPWNICLFWSVLFIAVVMIADETAYLAVSIWNPLHLPKIESPGTIRLFAMLFYYIILGGFCYLYTRKNLPSINLPATVILIFYITIVCGILLFYTQLDMTILLTQDSTTTNPALLYSSELITILLIGFFILLIVLIFYVGQIYNQFQELQFMYLQKDNEKQQYQTYQEVSDLIHQWRHDYQHHIVILANLSKSQDWNTLSEYLDKLVAPINELVTLPSTGNPVLDMMISSKTATAKQSNIIIDWSIFMPSNTPLTDIELTSILGNILDNAICACQQLSTNTPPVIHLSIHPHHQLLLIASDNPSNGVYKLEGKGTLHSTKNNAHHGYGLQRIQQIVQNHGGSVNISPNTDNFSIQILIPLSEITSINSEITERENKKK